MEPIDPTQPTPPPTKKHSYLDTLLFGEMTKQKKIILAVLIMIALVITSVSFWIGFKGTKTEEAPVYATPTPEPVISEEPTPTDIPEITESPTPTKKPSLTPTKTPTPTISSTPTNTPGPTNTPTNTPTSSPTSSPTPSFTPAPTATPSGTF